MKKKLRVVELYAGTGRSFEPFRKWKATELSLLVDNNPYAAEVYKHNFGGAPYLVSDLSTLSSRQLQNASGGEIDILLGCPPCQGYSDNGLRISNDSRNDHMDRFTRYVNDLRPLAVALENVPLAARSIKFKRFTEMLDRIGYRWTASIVNAATFGSCQSRQRLLLVAIRKDLKVTPKFPTPTHGLEGKYFSYRFMDFRKMEDDLVGMLGVTPGTRRVREHLPIQAGGLLGSEKIPTVRDIIGDLPKVSSLKGLKMGHFQWAHRPDILKKMELVPEGGRLDTEGRYFSQTYGRLHRKGLARTITNYFPNAGSGRYWHPLENRSLSLREAARIQGFPDSFEFLSQQSENCTLVGNALDASLAAVSYGIIRNCLES